MPVPKKTENNIKEYLKGLNLEFSEYDWDNSIAPPTKTNFADQFITYIKFHSDREQNDDDNEISSSSSSSSSELTIDTLNTSLQVFIHEADGKTLKKINNAELVSFINNFFKHKIPAYNSKLSDCLSAFFSVYRTHFYELNNGLQTRLILIDPWADMIAMISNKLPEYLETKHHQGIYLKEEKLTLTNNKTLTFDQLIEHCFEILESPIDHAFFHINNSIRKKIDACRFLMNCQEWIPENKRITYITLLFSQINNNPNRQRYSVTGDYLVNLAFEAITNFKDFIPAENRIDTIDKLINQLIDCCEKQNASFVSPGPGSTLNSLIDLISETQQTKIIDTILSYLVNNKSTIASKMLTHFKDSITETHHGQIRELLTKISDNQEKQPFLYTQYVYLSLLLPEAEQQQHELKLNVENNGNKFFNILRKNLRIIDRTYDHQALINRHNNPYSSPILLDDRCVSAAKNLALFKDIIPAKKQLGILHGLLYLSYLGHCGNNPYPRATKLTPEHIDFTNYKNFNTSTPSLRLHLQLLVLKDFFPKATFNTADYPFYDAHEEEQETQDTKENENPYDDKTKFESNVKIDPNNIKHYIVQPILNIISQVNRPNITITCVNALEALHYSNGYFPDTLKAQITYCLAQGLKPVENDKADKRQAAAATSLRSWLNTMTTDERAILLMQLMPAPPRNNFVKLDFAALFISVYHHHQQDLLKLQNSHEADCSELNDALNERYKTTSANQLAIWNKNATVIQSLLKTFKPKYMLKELRIEKDNGIAQWKVREEFKTSVLQHLDQITNAVKNDDLKKARNVVFELNAFSQSHLFSFNIKAIQPVSDIDQRRFGIKK